jgi:hypothetical protein
VRLVRFGGFDFGGSFGRCSRPGIRNDLRPGTKGRAFRGATLFRRCRTLLTDGRSSLARRPPIGAARYRWRSAPEPTGDVRVRSGGSRVHSPPSSLRFPPATGSLCRRATGTRPVQSPLFVMWPGVYGRLAAPSRTRGWQARAWRSGRVPRLILPPADPEGAQPTANERQPGHTDDGLGEDREDQQDPRNGERQGWDGPVDPTVKPAEPGPGQPEGWTQVHVPDAEWTAGSGSTARPRAAAPGHSAVGWLGRGWRWGRWARERGRRGCWSGRRG